MAEQAPALHRGVDAAESASLRRTVLLAAALAGACFSEASTGSDSRSASDVESGGSTSTSSTSTSSSSTSSSSTSSASDHSTGNDTSSSTGDTVADTTTTDDAPLGMVLLYDFEDAGISIPDRSPNGLDGSIAGTPFVTDDGRFGRGVSFPGGVAWLETPDHPLLDLADAFTLEAWVRLGNVGVVGLFDKGCCEAAATNYHVNVGPSGVAGNYAIAGPCVISGVETGIVQGVWAHVAVTFDGATLRYFVDAVEVAAADCAGPLPVNATGLTIGQYPYLEGTLDDIAVFDHARAADQICDDARGTWNGSSCDVRE
jgi:hypothetical protein